MGKLTLLKCVQLFKSTYVKGLQLNPFLKRTLLVSLDFHAFMFKQIVALQSEV
jgi:hypothetical protein